MSDEAAEVARKASTASAWKKNAVHEIVLPSGTIVSVKLPNLPAMLEAGDIPNHLIDAALGVAKGGDDTPPTVEKIKQNREFTDILVASTVVEPKITLDDARDIPVEDKDVIVAIATRQRDFDAEGNHIAGLDKSEKFRRFHRIGEFDPLLEDL